VPFERELVAVRPGLRELLHVQRLRHSRGPRGRRRKQARAPQFELDVQRLVRRHLQVRRRRHVRGSRRDRGSRHPAQAAAQVVGSRRRRDRGEDLAIPLGTPSPLGQGLGYVDRQWPRLLLFLEDGNIEATNNRRERELRRLVIGRKNWLFTRLDGGGARTGDILTIIATCIAHDVNPRAYLHRVVHCIVHGWPQSQLRDLLPDRMLAAHPELFVGDPDSLPIPAAMRALPR
jgi:hypothetical protein